MAGPACLMHPFAGFATSITTLHGGGQGTRAAYARPIDDR